MVDLVMEETGKGFLHEPEEWLPATLTSVVDGDDYGFGPTIKLILHLDGDTGDDGIQRETWAMASAKLSPRSKLYGWIKGIDPKLLPEVGGTIQLSQLENKRVDVMFEHHETDDGTKERVTKIRGSKTKAPAKPAPTAADMEAPF
jgi:hypothetical protein